MGLKVILYRSYLYQIKGSIWKAAEKRGFRTAPAVDKATEIATHGENHPKTPENSHQKLAKLYYLKRKAF